MGELEAREAGWLWASGTVLWIFRRLMRLLTRIFCNFLRKKSDERGIPGGEVKAEAPWEERAGGGEGGPVGVKGSRHRQERATSRF